MRAGRRTFAAARIYLDPTHFCLSGCRDVVMSYLARVWHCMSTQKVGAFYQSQEELLPTEIMGVPVDVRHTEYISSGGHGTIDTTLRIARRCSLVWTLRRKQSAFNDDRAICQNS